MLKRNLDSDFKVLIILSQILTFLSFQPTSGGKHITKDKTHSPAINIFALEWDIILGYVTGLVTATYRSNEMAQRLRILAVHIQTSMANQILHQRSPKIQTYNKKRELNQRFYQESYA